MRRLLAFLLLAAAPAGAVDHAAIADGALEAAILPGFETLAGATAALDAAAAAHCAGAPDAGLMAAYAAAFDAWMGVAQYRFGPLEEGEAGFAIAFWPDVRGATPRALGALVAAEDPVVDDPAAFAELSVAGRGLFALDATLAEGPPALGSYACRLTMALARDLDRTAAGARDRWRDPYAGWLARPGPDNPLYLAPEEASRALYTALLAGLEATSDLRLGRPLGTLDKPQPRRAEAWRTGRPARNAALALASAELLWEAAFAPEVEPEARGRVDAAFDAAARALADAGPIEVAVTEPGGRIRVEAAQQAIDRLRETLAAEIGPALGLAGGFNSLDGD